MTSTRNDETAMRSSLSLIVLMAVLLIATSGAAPPGDTASPDAAREDALASNARRLERWRKDPEHHARLQRDLIAFWEMSPERRALLRKLDHDLHQEDSATQTRLWGVLERYHSWLMRLPEEDRRRVESTGDWRKRLEVVRDLREQEWVRRQPPTVQKRIKALASAERRAEIARLREEQRQQHREATHLDPRRDRPTRLSDFPPEVESFVKDSLRPLLTPEERQRLDQAENRPWPLYARTVAVLSEKHPVPLPGPIGPVRIADLPLSLQRRMRENANRFPMAALRRAEGLWPEFGVALLSMQWKKEPGLDKRFRPAHLEDFSPAVRDFVSNTLVKTLTIEEKEQLRKADGNWPKYPQTLLELSRKHGLQMPGLTLPGPRELWDRAKAALPEVPERTLYHFLTNELTKEDRDRLRFSPGDPAARERLKQEFFKRHPRELRRLQQLDRKRNSPPKERAD